MTTTIFKRRLVPLLLAACFGAAVAAPTGQQVVAGQATFNQQGNVFSITNTPGTIINWQSFSINPGEITRFIQQGADSAVLNRIVGQDPSRIFGALQSNGKVLLINPNGVLFGRDSRVDVNGLVASSLNISNADFLAGKKNFKAGAVAGDVRNEGAITTPNGGQVYLIAPNVANAGIITSPRGEVVLAAGHSVQLLDSRDPDLQVVVSAPADQALNLGKIVAQGGRIGIYGALVNQRGIVNADSAVVGANGKIVLKASHATQLDAGSVTSAVGAGTGGEIHLLGDAVALNGNAAVNASGAAGGGTVLVGGDWQGKNAQLPNASQTRMSKDASIRADALVAGDGGKVVLWSNGSTVAQGSISAQGGVNGGNGGKIETSGHNLDVAGIKVRAGAAKGRGGDWLLDPYDIEVKAGGTASAGDVADASKGPATGVAQVAPTLLTGTGANIMLQAQHDVTFTDALTSTSDVTASAGHDLNVNANITSSSGNVMLHAANGINLASGASIKSNNYIDLIADQMSLSGSIGSAGGQQPVVTFNPATDGRQIQIGGAQTTGALWLDAAKLSSLPAFEINVGSSANTGGISVQSGVSQTGSVVLDTAGPISIDAPVSAGANGSVVATLHGASGTLLSVNAPVSAGKLIQLKGDGLRIGAAVTAPSVVLAPHSAQTGFSLGKLQEGYFSLDEAMLKQVNASGNLTIGGQPGQVGQMEFFGPIDLTSHPFASLTFDAGAMPLTFDAGFTMPSGLLSLKTSSALYASSTAPLTAGQLAFNAGPVTLAGANHIGTIAGTSTDKVFLTTADDLRVGQVGGQSGVRSTNGGVSITTGGALTVDSAVTGVDQVTLSSKGIGGAGTVSANLVVLQSTAGIGSATAPLNLKAAKLQGYNQQAGNAPINISNAGNLSITSLIQGGTSAGNNTGGITVTNSGNLSVDVTTVQPVSTSGAHVSADVAGGVRSGAGSIALTAGGALAVNGAVASESGNIGLTAGGDMTIAGAVTSTSGNLKLAAGSGGKFTVLQGASVASTSGSIDVTAATTSIASGTVTGSPDKIHVPGTQPAPAPTLAQCAATPTASGCETVLANARNACSADWNAGFCDQVMPADAVAAHTALLACIANPNGPNCGSVLPTADSCKAKPSQAGCDASLAQRAQVDACIANPTLACFSSTLPSYVVCQKAPDTYGCSTVVAHQSAVQSCVANPTSANCGGVLLPTLAACQADASIAGCSATLARQQFVACVANPSAAGCASVLPALSFCKANRTAEGCQAVLAQTFSACLVNPNDASCVGVLPTISECVADKTKAGCQVVLPTLAQCAASPSLQGCAVVLPTLAQCVASPSQQGCAVVLPTLAQCVASPSLQGCSAVLPTMAQCVASPSQQGCSVVLPTLAQCIASPSSAGCQAVLPTMAQCISSPTQSGCSVVLPALAQCAANPGLAGCEAVLPKPDFCSTHPTDASCQIFNPSPGSSGDSKTPATPVSQTVQTTVTLINSSTATAPASSSGSTSAGVGAPGGTSSTSTSSSSDSSSDKGSDKQSDKQSGPAASENSGAKNEKPATKTYCN